MMDRRFFEFWGQLFLDMARTQKQMEDMNRLFREGLAGFGTFPLPFSASGDARKGDGHDEPSGNDDSWVQAAKQVQESLPQVMALWNVVSKEDYDLLAQRLSEAERQVEECEQTIHTLRGLVKERQSDPLAATNNLQGLLARQQEAFESLLNNLGQLPREGRLPPHRGKRKTKG
jgi:hypothetical protein